MSNLEQNLILNSFFRASLPKKQDTYDLWAEQKRVLPKKSSSEPGKWKNDRTPFLRAIMKSLSPQCFTERVIFIKPTQIGGTEVGLNFILASIDLYGGPMLLIMPTEPLVKKFSNSKLTPSIKAIPTIMSKMKNAKSHDDGGGLYEKDYEDGMFSLGWSFSPSSFASFSAQRVVMDDVDRFPNNVAEEGDPLELGVGRADAFSNRKIYINSTPTTTTRSKIIPAYANSNQQLYFMHCPECREKMIFDDKYFKYNVTKEGLLDGEPYMVCPNCGGIIEEHHKTKMMSKEDGADWIAQNPNHHYHGYKINSYYSPIGWLSWINIALERIEAEKDLAKGNSEKIKKFKNTRLGEGWDDSNSISIDIETSDLLNRREPYTKLPNKTILLTAGVDTQHNRFEILVLAWLSKRVKYVVGMYVVGGDPKSKETQALLDKFLFEQTWELEDGQKMKIWCSTLDTGGDRTDAMYDYCRTRPKKNLYAIKGGGSLTDPLVKDFTMTKTQKNRDVKLFVLGVNSGKDDIIEDLKEESDVKYYHFPINIKHYVEDSPIVIKKEKELDMSDEQFFTQLITEKLDKNGRWQNGGKKVNEPKRPNEAIDCMVYANASLGIYNMIHKRIRRKRIDLDLMAEEGLKKGLVETVVTPKRKRRRIYSKGI